MLGEALALASAVSWGAAVVLYKKSDEVHPEAMNLFKNVVGVTLLGLTLLVLGDSVQWDRDAEDWGRLIASGLIGIAVADTLAFAALARLDAGLMAVVETSYAPSMVLLSVAFLGEPLGAMFVVGGTLVAAGVFVASYQPRTSAAGPSDAQPVGKPVGHAVGGAIAMGVGSIVLMSIGVILAKPALDRGEVVEVTFIRLVAGTAGQLLVIIPRRAGRKRLAIFRPQAVWKTLLPASICGGYLAMLFWIGGFKYTSVSVAAILGQMATIFTLVFARIFLAEPLSGG